MRLADGSRSAIAAVLTGVAAGAGGTVLTLLLHALQHLTFGYVEATFLAGVERAAPSRRVVAMAIGGLIVDVGWWALCRWRKPVPQSNRHCPTPAVHCRRAYSLLMRPCRSWPSARVHRWAGKAHHANSERSWRA